MFRRITSRSITASVAVDDTSICPGLSTFTAYSRKSGISSGLRSSPPLACGFPEMRLVPVGAIAFNSGISAPASSNNSSGR